VRRGLLQVAEELNADAEGGLRLSRLKHPRTGPILRRGQSTTASELPKTKRPDPARPWPAALLAVALAGGGAYLWLRGLSAPPSPPPPAPVEQPIPPAKPEAPRDGHLQLRVDAKHARFKLDGAPVGDGSGVLLLEKIAPGAHRIAVEAKGYAPREALVQIREGELASLEWTLDPLRAPPPVAKPAPGKPADPDEQVPWPPE
jgi:hypothetical protein